MNNLAQNKLQAAQQQRKAELDAREQALESREAYIEALPHELKVATATVLAKQEELLALKHQETEEITKHHQAVAEREQKLRQLDQDIARQEREASRLADTNRQAARDATNETEQLRKEQRELERIIVDRKVYQEQQEHLISDAIEQGNEQLLTLRGRTDDLEDRHKVIEFEILDLDEHKTALFYEYEAEKTEIGLDKGILENQLDRLREACEEERVALASVKEEAHQIRADISEERQQLQALFNATEAKREALALERQELETEKRRWAGKKALYDLQ